MTTPEPRQPLLPVIEDALRAFDIESTSSSHLARIGRLSTAAAIYDVLGYADDSTSLVVCTFTFPVRVPAPRRAAVGETLLRINTDTPVGAFELDYDTGVVRFRTGADLEGLVMVPHTFLMMLSASRHLCDTYHAAIMGVAFGDVDPVGAVAVARAALAAATTTPDLADDADDELDVDDVAPISQEELDEIIRELELDVSGDPHAPDENVDIEKSDTEDGRDG